MVRVIVCRPGETAAIEEIDDSLESMQRLVGGMIEEYQPFYDLQDPRVEDAAVFCNEEGKLNRLPPSRAVTDEDGRVMDIIAGPFFICFQIRYPQTPVSQTDDGWPGGSVYPRRAVGCRLIHRACI